MTPQPQNVCPLLWDFSRVLGREKKLLPNFFFSKFNFRTSWCLHQWKKQKWRGTQRHTKQSNFCQNDNVIFEDWPIFTTFKMPLLKLGIIFFSCYLVGRILFFLENQDFEQKCLKCIRGIRANSLVVITGIKLDNSIDILFTYKTFCVFFVCFRISLSGHRAPPSFSLHVLIYL